LAKKEMATIVARRPPSSKRANRFPGRGRPLRDASSFRKRKCIARPMTTEKTTAPTARARPNSIPRMRAVRTIARMLIAGPE
jgi:hypothetical protein